MTDKRVITDDAGCELSDLQLRVPADWIFMREDTEKARSLDRLGLSVQLDGVCTSLELAEISGRRHDNILRDIEEMESNLTPENESRCWSPALTTRQINSGHKRVCPSWNL